MNTVYSPPFQKFQQFAVEPSTNKSDTKKALIGASIGTILPVAYMLKTQKTINPLKLNYKLKDILILSGSSIIGGMLGGMYKENKTAKKNKFKEGVFQLLNASLPTISVAGLMKLCETKKKLNSVPCKFIAVMSGIASGMFGAIKLTNKIFDPKNKHPDRKLSAKDFVATADDAVGALALAKFPLIQKLHLDKTLPLAFGYCGYRAGKAE